MTKETSPIIHAIPASCAPSTEALEYLLVVLHTKLSRLRSALAVAPLPARDTRPIIDSITRTELLIADATEFLGVIRREFESLQEQVPS